MFFSKVEKEVLDMKDFFDQELQKILRLGSNGSELDSTTKVPFLVDLRAKDRAFPSRPSTDVRTESDEENVQSRPLIPQPGSGHSRY
jgi:hypothetical protein